MWIILTLFALIDGVCGRNPQPWAAPIRAGMIAAMVGVGVVLLWRARVRLSPGTVVLVGVLSALAVADLYQRSTIGISTWLVYAGAYLLQCAIKRDWRADFAMAGTVLAVLALIVVVGTAIGIPKPAGAWNYNSMGGIMASLLPAAITLTGRRRWITSAVISAGVLVSTSRGAALGALSGLAVIVQPWLLVAMPIAGLALAFIRPVNSLYRFFYWSQALDAWRSSIVFGVGPGLQMPWEGIHVHNTLLGMATQVGLVGIAIMTAAVTLARRIHMERWQLATLAVVAVHGLVDDPLAWLPVGVIASQVLVGSIPSERR